MTLMGGRATELIFNERLMRDSCRFAFLIECACVRLAGRRECEVVEAVSRVGGGMRGV